MKFSYVVPYSRFRQLDDEAKTGHHELVVTVAVDTTTRVRAQKNNKNPSQIVAKHRCSRESIQGRPDGLRDLDTPVKDTRVCMSEQAHNDNADNLSQTGMNSRPPKGAVHHEYVALMMLMSRGPLE